MYSNEAVIGEAIAEAVAAGDVTRDELFVTTKLWNSDHGSKVEAACRDRFGVAPRPDWLRRSFGDGSQLAASLRNVVFTDGDKDPWRVGGVPGDARALSRDGSVVHVLIADAAHHQDLLASDPADSPGVVAARVLEFEHVSRWVARA